MKKLISFFTVAFFLCMSIYSVAQVDTYTFTNGTSPYADLAAPTTFSISAGGGSADDGTSALQPIGFTFQFGGNLFTDFSVCSNGFVKLGSISTAAEYAFGYNAYTGAGAGSYICYANRDLNNNAGSVYGYELSGIAGSQILKIEAKNFYRYNDATLLMSVQVWLYETSNKVEIHYGPNVVWAVGNVMRVGLRGVAASNVRSLSGSGATAWSAAVAGISTLSTVSNNPNNADLGRTFTFDKPLPPPQFEAGVSASNLLSGRLYSVGKCYDFTATVTSYGTDPLPPGIPVYYTVNAGSPIGPVLTTAPILPAGSEVVSFTGGLGFCPSGPGPHTIDIYTQAGPPVVNRPALAVLVDVATKITTLPYLETFTAPVGWTQFIEVFFGSVAPWSIATCTNPDGVALDNAAFSNFYGGTNSAGRIAVLRSPEFDFTNIPNPVLHFYVAMRAYTPDPNFDRIQVLVSTDGGLTFFPASTPYNKTWATDPSLATMVASGSPYTPSAEGQWRHETVDLSNVGGNPNVVIGWRATSDYGNNAWIDNVIVSQPTALCNDNVAPAPGSYSCNSAVTLHFTNTPAPPPDGVALNNNESRSTKTVEKSKETGIAFPSYESGVPFIPSANTDYNPNGGTAFVSEYYNVDPGQSINANAGATNPYGNTYTPSEVYWINSSWYTVTYDGNDYTGYATYNIDIDVTGMGFADYQDLYIVKRTDRTGNWTCMTTTSPSVNILRVTGLTDFSDFGIAGNEVQPVELASFTSMISGRDVTLNWATTSETNNQGFDIERSSVNGSWSKIAEVAGNGTTTSAHSYSFTDRNLASGNYSYRLKQIDFNGNFEYFNLSNEVNVGIPSKFDLSQNYPNPFNPSTSISFDLPVNGNVSLKIYDMSGKEVMTLVNEVRSAGYYSVNFNASSLSSGVYFYTLSADNFTATKKMMLLK